MRYEGRWHLSTKFYYKLLFIKYVKYYNEYVTQYIGVSRNPSMSLDTISIPSPTKARNSKLFVSCLHIYPWKFFLMLFREIWKTSWSWQTRDIRNFVTFTSKRPNMSKYGKCGWFPLIFTFLYTVYMLHINITTQIYFSCLHFQYLLPFPFQLFLWWKFSGEL